MARTPLPPKATTARWRWVLTMSVSAYTIRGSLALALVLFGLPAAVMGAEPGRWDPAAAARYLDARADTWFAFKGADRGEGPTRVSCLSCHTSLPYVLARPALRKIVGAAAAT